MDLISRIDDFLLFRVDLISRMTDFDIWRIMKILIDHCVIEDDEDEHSEDEEHEDNV